MSPDQLRLGDAERDRAATELADHYAAGRLTAEEHSERLDRIWAARTRGDLAPVFRDLPAPDGRRPSGRGPGDYWRTGLRPFHHGLPGPLLAVIGVLVLLSVLTHLPLVLLAVGAWAFVAVRRGGGPGHRGHGAIHGRW
ncbi:DUF1707 domain-containing protein [Nocardioides sp. SYSU D00038]|uniref:DUF1707 SHOCT-like domain-containing protein n=1 Tax=Nocardioides sp. SYSU D00038 TaxID=2812554 RepID=UPI001966D1D6|nr:DUF1707 domain-containing protein [Nocardioides sp. SYSU D00038]